MTKIYILQVIPALTFGGISSVVMNWYRHLDKTKYQFDFITFSDGPLREEINQLGGKIYLLPTLRQAPLTYLKQLTALFGSEKSYDAIHVHNSFKNGVMLWLAKRAGIPVRICHSHTSGVENKWLLPAFSFLRWLAKSQSTAHVACGQQAGQFLFGQQAFEVINNAIAVQRFSGSVATVADMRQKYQLPPDKLLVLHVGRFSIVKNHQFLLSLALDTKLTANVHFVCIGEGPLKAEFIENIDQQRLSDRFSVLKANQDVAALLAHASAFIMPSLFEGVSVALLEAQAARLPCLISDTIAPECDMGLGLVDFLPLGATIAWLNRLNQLGQNEVTVEQVANAFDDKGYSIQSILVQLDRLYQPISALNAKG